MDTFLLLKNQHLRYINRCDSILIELENTPGVLTSRPLFSLIAYPSSPSHDVLSEFAQYYYSSGLVKGQNQDYAQKES